MRHEISVLTRIKIKGNRFPWNLNWKAQFDPYMDLTVHQWNPTNSVTKIPIFLWNYLCIEASLSFFQHLQQIFYNLFALQSCKNFTTPINRYKSLWPEKFSNWMLIYHSLSYRLISIIRFICLSTFFIKSPPEKKFNSVNPLKTAFDHKQREKTNPTNKK